VAGAWTILAPRHAGITVSDLDRSLDFYCGLLGIELLWRRLYEEPEIGRIVGVPDATGFDIAMLQLPGGDVQVELLEYRG
jgi:catechol 2,3-dioxygenase-like lactoylglutathione lyase family enzyme